MTPSQLDAAARKYWELLGYDLSTIEPAAVNAMIQDATRSIKWYLLTSSDANLVAAIQSAREREG